jgi:hypothetical protein
MFVFFFFFAIFAITFFKGVLFTIHKLCYE